MNTLKNTLKKLRDYTEVILALFLVITIMLIFTTADTDITPPKISNLTITEIGDTSAVITWITDEAATSDINYGFESENYLFEYTNDDLVTQHSLLMSNLSSNTSYYYSVSSMDLAGNINKSTEMMFTTLSDQIPPIWKNVFISPQTSTYLPNQTYVMGMDFVDVSGILFVNITHNFTGILQTQQVQTYLGNENISNSTYYFEIQGLPAGNYFWYMSATDTNGNTVQSTNQTINLSKAQSELELYFDSQTNNLQIDENSIVNITGKLITQNENKIFLILKNNSYESDSNEITRQEQFVLPGTYEVILKYNETQNYTATAINMTIDVKGLELTITANQQQYSIGQSAGYTIKFPAQATVNIEICGPIPESGSGFVECYDQPDIVNVDSPYARIHDLTKKIGDYIINAQTIYHGVTLSDSVEYEVTNSILIKLEGNTTIFTNDEVDISAQVTGGIGPYTYLWTLSDGTEISGDSFTKTYTTKGTYLTTLKVTDSQGNIQTKTFNLKVKEGYDVSVTVKDKESKKPVEFVEITLDDEEKITDSSGKVTFKLEADKYQIKIYSKDYKRILQTVEVDGVEEFVFELEKDNESQSTDFDINLLSPVNQATLTEGSVVFSANIITTKPAECRLYLTPQDSSWSEEIQTFSVETNSDISYTENVQRNKAYSWKIECDSNSKKYSSATRTFSTTGVSAFSSTESGEVLDAGVLRESLEKILDNINALDSKSKSAADALELRTKAERALRDYDRIIRDLNNINFRTDLSDSDKQAKISELKNNLKNLEKTVPLNILTDASESFVIYPKDEELQLISEEYAQETNQAGKLNLDFLKNIQNEISVQTTYSHVTLTYVDGTSKKITLIQKQITYSEEETPKGFLLEYIPKEVAQNTENIEFITKNEIIKKDPLIKFEKEKAIVYYVQGYISKEEIQNAHTLMFSDSVYSSKNSLTGNVVFSDLNITSPVAFIILLTIIIAAYLIYAYDVPELASNIFVLKAKHKAIDEFIKIINDSKEYLELGDVDKANLLFKEIRLRYEKAKFPIKKEVYEEALKLHKNINMKFFEKTFIEVERSSANDNIDLQKVSELIFVYNDLSEEAKNELSEDLKRAFSKFITNHPELLKAF